MPRGRHVRPSHRQPSAAARRTAVGATVVSTAAVPALGLAAPAAHAATGGIGGWAAVASCESSNDWSINTGNGFYGGVQFTEQTWLGYGGGTYAEYANEATPTQQIVVAERVLLGQGKGAWPVCGRGLTSSDAYVIPQGTAGVAQQQLAAAVPSLPLSAPAPSSGVREVTVASGDSLSALAERYQVAGGWQALWHANAATVSNPNLIFPGQRLRLP